MIYRVIIALFVGMGIYLIFADVFEVPTHKSVRSIISLNRKETQTSKRTILYTIAQIFVGIIKLEEYTKEKVEGALSSVGDSTSAEMYYAIGLTQFILSLLLTFILFLIYPIFAVISMLFGIIKLFNHMRQPDKLIKERREKIEKDLPRFVAIIEQGLKNENQIQMIVENYQKYAAPELAEELQTTIADMNTGSPEGALLRLESRVGSTLLSEVVRGMIRALAGDNPIGYFQMISNDFRALEVSGLRKDSLKRPQKIGKYSFLILMLVVFTVLGILGIYTFTLVPNLI